MSDAASISIRQGDIRSIDAVMPVMRAAFPPEFGEAWSETQCAAMLTLPGTELFIAEKNQSVSGFALIKSVFEESELLLIATHPDHRRSGVGFTLCRHIIQWRRNNGTRMVYLEVRDGNPALFLYSRLGFVPVGRRENYYKGADGKQFDALTLRLDIPSII